MDKFVISRLNKRGVRQYLGRVLPLRWSNYECDAKPLTSGLADSAIQFCRKLEPFCVLEKRKYRPPKLPKGEASP